MSRSKRQERCGSRERSNSRRSETFDSDRLEGDGKNAETFGKGSGAQRCKVRDRIPAQSIGVGDMSTQGKAGRALGLSVQVSLGGGKSSSTRVVTTTTTSSSSKSETGRGKSASKEAKNDPASMAKGTAQNLWKSVGEYEKRLKELGKGQATMQDGEFERFEADFATVIEAWNSEGAPKWCKNSSIIERAIPCYKGMGKVPGALLMKP